MEHTRYNKTITTDELSKNETCEIVREIIMEEYEKVLIERHVKFQYSFLEPFEREEIIKEAKKLSKMEDVRDFPSFSKRSEEIYKGVLSYLEENSTIVPCGFVDFRFKKLYFWVEAICAKALDIYFDRREYEEFTYLLKMFVESKDVREEVIHVIWEKDKIKLINKRGRDVTDKYQKEFIRCADKKELSKDDLTISAIISAAPEKLILHSPPSSPLVNALKSIFAHKCHTCNGCNVCKRY